MKANHTQTKYRLLLLFLVVVLIGIIIFITYSHKKWYEYNVKNNYIYKLLSRDIIYKKVIIKHNSILLPKLDYSNKTLLLKLDLQAKWYDFNFPPSLSIYSNNKYIKQVFAIGASGVRYVNISSLAQYLSSSSMLKIKRHLINVPDQHAVLLVIPNPSLQRKVLVIAAHPDDAEIGAFGLYSTVKKALIVTVTSGNAGDDSYRLLHHSGKNSYSIKGLVRSHDSTTVPHLGGIENDNTVNLGYPDDRLDAMFRAKSSNKMVLGKDGSDSAINRGLKKFRAILPTKRYNQWNVLVADLTSIINRFQPDIIVTPEPNLDSHTDHQLVTVALSDALKNAKAAPNTIFFYVVHPRYSILYPYGQANTSVSVSPWFNQSLSFDRIFSFDLSKEKQNFKFLALEDMSDLRRKSIPLSIYRNKQVIWQSLKPFLSMIKTLLIYPENPSFFRRAPRPNEIFYVIKNDQLSSHINFYLKNISHKPHE